MHLSHSDDLLRRLEHLNRIGIALSRERDTAKLLETILVAAKTLLHVDGGTLYRLEENNQQLRFEVLYNDSLQLYMGGVSGAPISFPTIPIPSRAITAPCLR